MLCNVFFYLDQEKSKLKRSNSFQEETPFYFKKKKNTGTVKAKQQLALDRELARRYIKFSLG